MKFWNIGLLGLLFILGCSGGSSGADAGSSAVDGSTSNQDAGSALTCRPCSGDFDVENVFHLEEAAQCQSISESLRMEYQDWLTEINLPCLTTVGTSTFSAFGSLQILENPLLSNLQMPRLIEVKKHLQIGSNPMLSNLSGLSGMTSVGGDLVISYNAALTSLSGLSGIASVGDDLRISGNAALTSLSDLSGISSLRGDLRISYNAALTSLSGLSGISSVGSAFISNNPCLSQSAAEAFAASIQVTGIVTVNDNGNGIGTAACP